MNLTFEDRGAIKAIAFPAARQYSGTNFGFGM